MLKKVAAIGLSRRPRSFRLSRRSPRPITPPAAGAAAAPADTSMKAKEPMKHKTA